MKRITCKSLQQQIDELRSEIAFLRRAVSINRVLLLVAVLTGLVNIGLGVVGSAR